MVITGRNKERLDAAAAEIGAERVAAFDAAEADQLERFFDDLTGPVDHVMVSTDTPPKLTT